MSLFDCIQRAIDDPEIGASKAIGERVQADWKERADMYERDGSPRHAAEQMAADDIKEAFKREAGEKRHVYLAAIAHQKKAAAHVARTSTPDMARRTERLQFVTSGLVRRFNGRLGAYLDRHAPSVLDLVKGKPRNIAEQMQIADELHGIPSGNPIAKALADGIREALEDLRIMFNEAGGLISKLDAWGLPHKHDRLAARRAGFDVWFKAIDAKLDWARITDPLTGRTMGDMPSEAIRRSFLKDRYRNIVFGRDAEDVVYGKPAGTAMYRKHQDQRHLHFKSGRAWMEYNRDFGTGGMHETLMGHVHRMARDIALMREFGPNPRMGAQYEADLWQAKIKGDDDETLIDKVAGDSAVAMRMLNVMLGGTAPSEPWMQKMAVFGSTARQAMTSAFLDRAIFASITDMNTMRLAGNAMGLNGNNMVAKVVGALPKLSKSEMRRALWVSDTAADGGSALARFQQEVAPRQWAERVSSISMRIQGLSSWTDRARATAYEEWGGMLDEVSDRPLADLNPSVVRLFRRWGITEREWDEFRRPEHKFVADNGATFLMPTYFRSVAKMKPRLADDLFDKFQGAAEEWLNEAVTTKSLLGQAWTDPSSTNLPAGHPLYELAKSGLMFKSFPITFTINQYRRLSDLGGWRSGAAWAHGGQLIVFGALLTAVGTQLNGLLFGRDPQDMTEPMFWAQAVAKSGGFGILGDIVMQGQASWGGGFASYLAGPMAQLMTDVYGISLGPAITAAWQAANGQDIDTGLVKALADAGRRYTPMGQTPLVGPAIDRLIWDQFQIALDPEAVDDLAKKAKAQEKRTGAGHWWAPGSPLPTRAPDLSTAVQ